MPGPKAICDTRQNHFVRRLISEVLSYSSGRQMEFADQTEIDNSTRN
jgi:Protein of unknown function (DUF1585)